MSSSLKYQNARSLASSWQNSTVEAFPAGGKEQESHRGSETSVTTLANTNTYTYTHLPNRLFCSSSPRYTIVPDCLYYSHMLSRWTVSSMKTRTASHSGLQPQHLTVPGVWYMLNK